ncbi:MAG TPA: hypothetical protein VL967_10080 [Terracidiphilus sp.]|nr:hypothetical protein [Terracidiphilus sp.]
MFEMMNAGGNPARTLVSVRPEDESTQQVGLVEGRGYNGRPVDASEALARRLERSEVIDPVVPVSMAEEEVNPVFPGTLDLRIPSSIRTEAREPLP